ncbi:MAG: hypothetical protein H3C43_04695 [Leptonema sp. (in: Bacteria)]|nr:hypothetical protein [Leptonema sp. (in: bacteria)]
MRILFPDHTAAIEGVVDLIAAFANTNQLKPVVYRLNDLKQNTTQFQSFLKEEKNAIVLIPTTVKIDESLHSHCQSMVYATASTGTDHVDFGFLAENEIPFVSAPGENSISVVEYVLSSLPYLIDANRLLNEQLSIGIVGYGRIGSLLGQVCQQLGFQVSIFDPLKYGAIPKDQLTTVLNSDIISFHVPLTKGIQFPTYQMIDHRWLDVAYKDSIWINSSRGQIIATDAFERLIQEHKTIIDVFPIEPAEPTWLKSSTLVSPHVAGYSWQGRAGGVYRVLSDISSLFGFSFPFTLDEFRPARFELSALNFINSESELLKKNPTQFLYRRNNYPTRTSFRQEIDLDLHLERFTDFTEAHKTYLQRIFEIWNRLHIY